MRRMLVDVICTNEACQQKRIDAWIYEGQYPTCSSCDSPTVRLWEMGSSSHVHGDECDVVVRHGICHDDGTPRRYTSKAEMARVAASKGLVNHVTHVPGKGTDKSKHTQRFV